MVEPGQAGEDLGRHVAAQQAVQLLECDLGRVQEAGQPLDGHPRLGLGQFAGCQVDGRGGGERQRGFPKGRDRAGGGDETSGAVQRTGQVVGQHAQPAEVPGGHGAKGTSP